MFLAQSIVIAAEEVDYKISFGIGAVALLILFGLMAALVAFGGGREHS